VSLTSTSCSSWRAAAAAVAAALSIPGSAAAILRNSALMLNPANAQGLALGTRFSSGLGFLVSR